MTDTKETVSEMMDSYESAGVEAPDVLEENEAMASEALAAAMDRDLAEVVKDPEISNDLKEEADKLESSQTQMQEGGSNEGNKEASTEEASTETKEKVRPSKKHKSAEGEVVRPKLKGESKPRYEQPGTNNQSRTVIAEEE